jgi:hypothetical protein
MKLQLKYLLTLIVILSLSFLSGAMQAQGIYSKNKDSQDNSSSPSLRAGKPGEGTTPPGGNGDQGGDGGPGGDSKYDPIGEGWLLVSALAGGYALLQKRKTKKRK